MSDPTRARIAHAPRRRWAPRRKLRSLYRAPAATCHSHPGATPTPAPPQSKPLPVPEKLGPHDFVVVPPEDYEEALIVKRSLRRAGPNKFRAKKYYAVFLRNNMKKTAVYADWDSVEVLKIKHTGYFKFKREKSFTAAYNRIVAFITHYNEKLCTDIDSDSEGDDE